MRDDNPRFYGNFIISSSKKKVAIAKISFKFNYIIFEGFFTKRKCYDYGNTNKATTYLIS